CTSAPRNAATNTASRDPRRVQCTLKMMRFPWLLLVCSTTALAQSFEASVSGGQTVIPAKSATIGTVGTSPTSDPYKMTDGWRLGARMTLNQWRFMGHEFGYMYSRTGVDIPASASAAGGGTAPVQPGSAGTVIASSHLSVPTHQGFYNFLVYAAPEGFIVRPFVTGGVQFTAFSQPNDYGNRETKYGV